MHPSVAACLSRSRVVASAPTHVDQYSKAGYGGPLPVQFTTRTLRNGGAMPPGQPSPAGGTPSWDGVGVAMALNAVVFVAVMFVVLYDGMSFIRIVETTVAGWLGLPSSAVPSHVTCAASEEAPPAN